MIVELFLDTSLISGYKSKSQMARVLTENWVTNNMFCPRCGCNRIRAFEDNRPVADFYCPDCLSEYELKSKSGKMQGKVIDGAYDSMIQRIMSRNNPDFFFMTYSTESLMVMDFLVVPKYFFVPDIIEKRKPLSEKARRAGWVGCNILLSKIPFQGRVAVVKDGVIQSSETVIRSIGKAVAFDIEDIESRGWLFDVLNCLNQIPSDEFLLRDVYAFENELYKIHPNNHNIKAKIRQQLQFLRDRKRVVFLGNGRYKKLF